MFLLVRPRGIKASSSNADNYFILLQGVDDLLSGAQLCISIDTYLGSRGRCHVTIDRSIRDNLKWQCERCDCHPTGRISWSGAKLLKRTVFPDFTSITNRIGLFIFMRYPYHTTNLILVHMVASMIYINPPKSGG
jgi:hypothetical protein